MPGCAGHQKLPETTSAKFNSHAATSSWAPVESRLPLRALVSVLLKDHIKVSVFYRGTMFTCLKKQNETKDIQQSLTPIFALLPDTSFLEPSRVVFLRLVVTVATFSTQAPF